MRIDIALHLVSRTSKFTYYEFTGYIRPLIAAFIGKDMIQKRHVPRIPNHSQLT